MGNTKVDAIVINSIPYIEGLENTLKLLQAVPDPQPSNVVDAIMEIKEMIAALGRGQNCFKDVQAIGT